MTYRRNALLTVCCFLVCTMGLAQDAVPGEILGRTMLIKIGNSFGTAFTIDHKGKLYLVTARHVVAGLPVSNATIQISRPTGWIDYHIRRILFPPSNHADIAVLDTGEQAAQPYEIANMTDLGGPTFGQQVWFLGYPWGLHTRLKNGEIPFIKRGTMSAIDTSDPRAVLLYIDGFNNPGFSGGPILYWDFSKHAYSIMGVVQGYRPDTAKVMVKGSPTDTGLLVNSGILIGYSIEHAIQAIELGNQTQR